jgi:EpsI family protein
MSLNRRDVMLAGLGVAALGTAEILRPRKRLVLLKSGATIAEAIPPEFGHWESNNADLVSPEQAGRLAKTLYSETVGRAYDNTEDGSTVLILAAYGDTQSDLLQLHRPESCYPAVGYTLELSQATTVDVGGGEKIPARRVIATMEDRRENIIYWTRLGERLPQGGGEQRDARLANAMDGYVADGILVRCSVIGESDEAFATLRRFIPEMLRSVKPALRPALVGTRIAQRVV